MTDRTELVTLAETLARQAGALLLAELPNARTIETKTSPTDLVSEVDRAVEALVVDGILAARPDDGIRGEEGASRLGTTGLCWVIDPLDGTTNYVYRLPAFAVSIGVEQDGVAIAGVVFDPSRGELFAATRGGGATCNGTPIRCSTADDLAHALVATGFGYVGARRSHQAEVLTEVLPAVRDIRRVGAASLDLCAVACGRVDAFYERGLAPWDWSAGALIAAEAGAVVGGLNDDELTRELTVAAAPGIAESLRTLLRNADAARD